MTHQWHVIDFEPEEQAIIDDLNIKSGEHVNVIKGLNLLPNAEQLQGQKWTKLIDELEEDIAELESQKTVLLNQLVKLKKAQATHEATLAAVQNGSNNVAPEELARLRVELQRAQKIITGMISDYPGRRSNRVEKWAERGGLLVDQVPDGEFQALAERKGGSQERLGSTTQEELAAPAQEGLEGPAL